MSISEVVRFGDVLRRARLNAGLDQSELATILGVSQGQISKWENGRGEPLRLRHDGVPAGVGGPEIEEAPPTRYGPEGASQSGSRCFFNQPV